MLKFHFSVWFLLAALTGANASFADTLSGKAAVIDGDTVEIKGRQVRLHGIDAPEAAQELAIATGGTDFLGRGAAMMLRSLIRENEVRCDLSSRADPRGLPLATCYSGSADLGAEMVASGMAWASTTYPSPYADAEKRARTAKKGFWRDNSEAPWAFRARRVNAAKSSRSDGCVFKAISDGGRKTLIAPWSPWYKDISVIVARGDRWFCSEAQAVGQGWLEPAWLIQSVVSGVYNPSN